MLHEAVEGVLRGNVDGVVGDVAEVVDDGEELFAHLVVGALAVGLVQLSLGERQQRVLWRLRGLADGGIG